MDKATNLSDWPRVFFSKDLYESTENNNNILRLSNIIKEEANMKPNTQVESKDEQAIIHETEEHMHIA